MSTDADRLRALESYEILDTPPETLYDRITELAATALGVPISLVSLIDADRQWFKSHHGLDAVETPRAWAFCDHAIRGRDPLIVENAPEDPRFAENPLVTGAPDIRFYAGVPIFSPDGHGLGTLCVIDREPRSPTASQIRMLSDLAHLVGYALEMHRKTVRLTHALEAQAGRQARRELMASMVVHDLRGPLTVILGTASLEAQVASGDCERSLRDIILAAERIERMSLDVLDLCLSETDELPTEPVDLDLAALLDDQVRMMKPYARRHGCTLEWTGGGEATARLDPDLTTRMIVNLFDNAVRHTPAGGAVKVELDAGPRDLEIRVTDAGPGVAPVDLDRIFEPRYRTEKKKDGTRNFGLGLAFCRLAAEAQGGGITVEDAPEGGARFRLRLPRRAGQERAEAG